MKGSAQVQLADLMLGPTNLIDPSDVTTSESDVIDRELGWLRTRGFGGLSSQTRHDVGIVPLLGHSVGQIHLRARQVDVIDYRCKVSERSP